MQAKSTILITGATSGIGQLAAVKLAPSSARLVLIARSEEKAASTRALIHETAPDTEVDIHLADMTEPLRRFEWVQM